MLKNYIKTAIAVLMRRKFFTFISLFGISLTLTVLMVVTAFLDHIISAQYPEVNRDRSLYISMIQIKNSKEGYQSMGPASFYYLDKYVSRLKTPEKMAISSLFASTNTFVNGKKLALTLKYTNAEFWEVMQFHFLEGKPFGTQQVKNNDHVAIITTSTARNYFGTETGVVGKTIETDNVPYRVCGVVQDVPVTRLYSSADIYIPYSASKAGLNNRDFMGNFIAVLMARTADDVPKMQAEYDQLVKKIPLPNPKEFDKLTSHADPYLATFTRTLFGNDDQSNGIARFYVYFFLVAFLFMLLPAINLVNINISRILERASEIGVRKAFGASSTMLVFQFVIENVFLTLLGGLIGILLALGIIYMINSSGMIPHSDLALNGKVFLVSLALCLFFGLISGVFPAFRMSRLSVVEALKN